MSCRLIFVRHGQSIGNVNNLFLGHTDLDLSPLGYKQAEFTAKYLMDTHIDKIYSSDLLRAYNTAVATADAKNLDIIKSENLREIFVGDWENTTFNDIEVNFPESYGIWRKNIGLANPENGESVAELFNRIIKEVTAIANENDGKTVAIFTHATSIRAFYCYCYGKTLQQMKDIPWVVNASVSRVLYENGCFTPLTYGEEDFLSGIVTRLPANV